jgi:hypothetical protein
MRTEETMNGRRTVYHHSSRHYTSILITTTMQTATQNQPHDYGGKEQKIENGLQLRIIPCLGSNSAVTLSDNQCSNMVLMATKQQQFFMNYYTVKLDNFHILNLDAPVEYATSQVATLRKYLISRSPTNSVIQRIFVYVDKSWRGNDFTLVAVKPYAADAIKALNCIIPECTFFKERPPPKHGSPTPDFLHIKTSTGTLLHKL